MKPLIGITVSAIDKQPAYGGNLIPQLTCNRSFVKSVINAGGCPILLTHEIDMIDRYVAMCDGFVFTGGDDIDPSHWGEPLHPKAKLIKPERQAFEFAMLKAIDQYPHKPVLGVCLGMQMMTVHNGGSIIQHLGDQMSEDDAVIHQKQTHAIKLIVNDHPQVQPSDAVASRHHQAARSPGRMRALAVSHDDVIEAVDLPDRPMYLGVQWHPEITADPVGGASLFEHLIRNALSNGQSAHTPAVAMA